MKDIRLKDILQILISLGLGVVVFYLVYKQLDMDEMKEIFHSTKWGYLVVPVILCLLSSLVRAVRWNMLIEPVAEKPKLKNTFCAVMFGYFVNHIFPRAGEVARCGVLKKYGNVPLSELFGTVITERAFDLLITLLIVLFTVVTEFDLFRGILASAQLPDFSAFIVNPYLWIGIFVIGALIFFFRKKIKQWKISVKIKEILAGVWKGLKSFIDVRNKPMFLLYSVLIFVIYYLMLYCSFWIFDFTTGLSLEAGLVTYVFGALGMVAPVQGGIGTYEFMTIQALALYGITQTQAGAFALIAHLVEIVVNCVVGFVCFLILPFINRN